jgi:hypothetical protein
MLARSTPTLLDATVRLVRLIAFFPHRANQVTRNSDSPIVTDMSPNP